MTRFLYHVHIMWYELEMVSDTLDSLSKALQYATIPVDIAVCFNKQTFLEKPITDNINEKFDTLATHPVLKNATIVEKTNNDSFFNVGDWRRTIKCTSGYTIWGESDTLIPNLYFPILEQLWDIRSELSEPHVISLASRKMWDETWLSVEHPLVKDFRIFTNGKSNATHPMGHDHTITQEELDTFNEQFNNDLGLTQINPPKIDGSMLALHPRVPQLIPDDLHMISEDYCTQMALLIRQVPQYHISNIIKGHNYHHPNKRTNTLATRNEFGEVIRDGLEFNELKNKSMQSIDTFLRGLVNG